MENNNLWAPWRSDYVGGEREPGCVFCHAAASPEDPERLVVALESSAMAVLNRYPYASGHLMVMPRRHVGALEELDSVELTQMWAMALKAKSALTSLYNPQGFNLGLNIGKAAGAGITEHLHIHVVPRWVGDNNFMAVLAETRVIPHHLEKIRTDVLRAMGA